LAVFVPITSKVFSTLVLGGFDSEYVNKVF